MTREEIMTIMSMPRSASLMTKYKQIYKIATGKEWTQCFCGNGATRFYGVIDNYYNKIKNEEND